MRFDPRSGWFWAGAAAVTLLVTVAASLTILLVSFLWRVSWVLGALVAVSVTIVYVVAAFFLIRQLRAPPALAPPRSTSAPAMRRYREEVAARLRANPRCESMRPQGPEDVDAVLSSLSREAEKLVEDTSATIFMSTAVAHSGSLEMLLVIGAEFRMAGRVAEIYWGPLSLVERLYLWRFLLTSGVVFAEIEDLEIVEEVRPLLGSLVGAALGGIPGLNVLSHLLIDAWLRGGANALLALRVGNATMQYCTAPSWPPKAEVSVQASRWAGARVGDTIRAGAKNLADRVAEEAGKTAKSGMGSLTRRLVSGSARSLDPTREFR
jgi:hypothetical protein